MKYTENDVKNLLKNNDLDYIDELLNDLDLAKTGTFMLTEDYWLDVETYADEGTEAKNIDSDYNSWLNLKDKFVYVDYEISDKNYKHLYSSNNLVDLVDEILGLDEVAKALTEV